MYTIYGRKKSTGTLVPVATAESIEQADDIVSGLQLAELTKRGYTNRYTVADESGNTVCAYFKLRLAQRDTRYEAELRRNANNVK